MSATKTVDQPTQKAPKAKKTARQRAIRAYRVLGPYGRPYRSWLVRGGLAAAAVVACRLAFPWPMRAVMQETLNAGNRAGALLNVLPSGDPVAWLIASFIVIIVLWGLAEHGQRLALTRFASAVTRDTRAATLRAVASRTHCAGEDPADLLSRIVTDNDNLKSGLKSILINATRNVVFLLSVGVIITIISWPIGLAYLAGCVGSLAIAVVGANYVSGASRKLKKKDGRLIEAAQQAIAGGTVDGPATVGTEPPRATLTRLEGRTTLAIHAWLALTTSGMLLLALHAGRSGRLSAADVFIILAYTLYTHNKTVSLGRTTVRLGKVLASAERLAKVLEPRPKKKRQ